MKILLKIIISIIYIMIIMTLIAIMCINWINIEDGKTRKIVNQDTIIANEKQIKEQLLQLEIEIPQGATIKEITYWLDWNNDVLTVEYEYNSEIKRIDKYVSYISIPSILIENFKDFDTDINKKTVQICSKGLMIFIIPIIYIIYKNKKQI